MVSNILCSGRFLVGVSTGCSCPGVGGDDLTMHPRSYPVLTLLLLLLPAACTGGPAPPPRTGSVQSGPASTPAAQAPVSPGEPAPRPAPEAAGVPAPPLPPPGPPPGYAFPAGPAPLNLKGEWIPANRSPAGGPGRLNQPLFVGLDLDQASAPYLPGAPVAVTALVQAGTDLVLEPLVLRLQVRLQNRTIWQGNLPPLSGKLTPQQPLQLTVTWDQKDAGGQPAPGGQLYQLVLVADGPVRYTAGAGESPAVLPPATLEAGVPLTLALAGAMTGTSYGPFIGTGGKGDALVAVTQVYMTPEATVVRGAVQDRGRGTPVPFANLHLVAKLPDGEWQLGRHEQQFREAAVPGSEYRTAAGFVATYAPVPARATALRLVQLDTAGDAVVWQVTIPLPVGTEAAPAPAGHAWVRKRVRVAPADSHGPALTAELSLTGTGPQRLPPNRPLSYRVQLTNAGAERLVLNAAVLRVEVRPAAAGSPLPIWTTDLPPLALELGPGEAVIGDFTWELQDALGRPVPAGRSYRLQLSPGTLVVTGSRGTMSVPLPAHARSQAAFALAFAPGAAAVAELAGPFTAPNGDRRAVVTSVHLTESGARLAGTLYARQPIAADAAGGLQLTALTPEGQVPVYLLQERTGGPGDPESGHAYSLTWQADFDPVPASARTLVLQDASNNQPALQWQVLIPLD